MLDLLSIVFTEIRVTRSVRGGGEGGGSGELTKQLISLEEGAYIEEAMERTAELLSTWTN